jgi:hypothetical protein
MYWVSLRKVLRSTVSTEVFLLFLCVQEKIRGFASSTTLLLLASHLALPILIQQNKFHFYLRAQNYTLASTSKSKFLCPHFKPLVFKIHNLFSCYSYQKKYREPPPPSQNKVSLSSFRLLFLTLSICLSIRKSIPNSSLQLGNKIFSANNIHLPETNLRSSLL